MSSENGFIDLRLNQEGSNSGNESFWPSFTDIMTVIVMIFLIALVVLLMRNMELVQQLRNTMEAERMAAELARTTGEEKESLSLRLIHTENELSDLRLELMKLQEIRNKQLEAIKDNLNQINLLSSQRDKLDLANTQLQQKNIVLENQNKQLALEKDQTQNRLLVSNEQLEIIRQALAALEAQQQTTEQQLANLQDDYADKNLQLEQALNRIANSDTALSELQGDYDQLKVKYDKLVRPARTAAGKYVVEVRYSKVKGKYRIAYKTPEQDKFQDISKKSIEKKLAGLKKSKSNKLYIKVIFPENSGLSYSEAWEFTTSMHKYDYYYQEDQ